MKLLVLLVGALVALSPFRALAADSTSASADLKALVAQINGKLRQGQDSPEALKAELATFDTLLAKYRETDREGAAEILFSRGTLHAQVFGDEAAGRKLLGQVKTDFPQTRAASRVDAILAALDRQASRKEAQTAIVGKPAPALHVKWASREGLKTLADLKGKVVVLDFWATWCGPCVASFPHLRELTEYYKGYDVEVVGVTSLQGRVIGLDPATIDTSGAPEKELALMTDYIKAKDITWTVVFTEEQVFNQEYGILGIPHLAIVAPDGTVRHNGLHPSMPRAEKIEKIDALLKEAGKRTPAKS